ncbi:hypothetical protein N5P21_18410 [Pseudomonas citronellolis]|uniref:hypothetical protein n=1 Tax=Pseudomonas citronellolis TaxID=53408 RepID=UPI0021C135B2|nr:hypothetical protein [Pseudomonas citronellolis]UXJ49967.1 hypothetical protein N5P21_18410 [Pseudomonas citronellolis]
MLPKAAHTPPKIEAAQPSMKEGVTGTAGKPTSRSMPSSPRASPAAPARVMRSSPQRRPMTMENSGMAATKIAAMAVPISGVAKVMPISWPATVVAPTTHSGRHRPRKSSTRPLSRAAASRVRLAISARKLTAPTQPKPAIALSSTRNDRPQATARYR